MSEQRDPLNAELEDLRAANQLLSDQASAASQRAMAVEKKLAGMEADLEVTRKKLAATRDGLLASERRWAERESLLVETRRTNAILERIAAAVERNLGAGSSGS